MLSDKAYDRLIVSIGVVGTQAASAMQIYESTPKVQLGAFFLYGLASSWLAYTHGDNAGFKRGLKVMENLR